MISFRHKFLVALLPTILAGCARVSEHTIDVDSGGHRLHLLVVSDGRQKPTVVLESGAGGNVSWPNTRNQVARFAQVVTYDRAGTGDSQPGPEPRDANSVAADLHAALHQAGIAPPFVLVGQSLGGLYIQVFAAMYPEETAGLVLVDPTYATEEACEPIDKVKAWFMAHQPDDWPRVHAQIEDAPFGFAGFMAYKYKLMETFIETVPEPQRSAMRTEWWAMIEKLVGKNPHHDFTGGWRAEATAMADSFRQTIAARPLPEVPTILLSAGKMDLDALPADASTPNVRALQAEARRWKLDVYQKWVDQTPGAKLVVVPDSFHDIESQNPQAVIDAVREVLP